MSEQNETSEVNEQLKKFLLEVLKETKDFTVQQSPEVFKQYVEARYFDSMIELIIYICYFVLFTVGYSICWSLAESKIRYQYSDLTDWNGWMYAACWLSPVMVVSVIDLAITLNTTITTMWKAKNTPKALLLERFL